jgi:hypothetical protein
MLRLCHPEHFDRLSTGLVEGPLSHADGVITLSTSASSVQAPSKGDGHSAVGKTGEPLAKPFYCGLFVPYFDRLFFRSSTPTASRVPRTMW